MSLVLDTHAVIWYLLDDRRLPNKVFELIESSEKRRQPVFVSAITLVEIIYLVERGRVLPDIYDRLVSELNQDDSVLFPAAVDADVVEKLRKIPRDSVPDMPDRIIVATALHLGLPLVTRDRQLQNLGIQTIW